MMTGSYHRVLNACFINLHSWCEIAPVPIPAMCRVIQSVRSRLHGHAKAKRDRTSGWSRVVEATKEHYLAWRDKMGRQRAGQAVQIRPLAGFSAGSFFAPNCAIYSRLSGSPGCEARSRAGSRSPPPSGGERRRTMAKVTRARVSRSVPDATPPASRGRAD